MHKFLRAMELIEQANKLLTEAVMEKEITYTDWEQIHKNSEKSLEACISIYNKGAVK
ncbi:hypothetical protein LD11_gp282 [Bacillus phage Riley]|uniref:Uncharacterized protein n=1 Tax=Bacillus phage Riley TaxID=1486662 RepID=A0A075LZ12_9CAUD|nr:hypothetical protein LD11_gp282 [Bacillus phage Riley]AIF72158.1 hypothetical protein [Bacillus phage Riley]